MTPERTRQTNRHLRPLSSIYLGAWISLLPSSVGDSEEAYVVVNSRPHRRSQDVSYLEASLPVSGPSPHTITTWAQESPMPQPEFTTGQASPTWVYRLTGAARLSGSSTNSTRILPRVAQDSDTKILRCSLIMRYLQLYSTIPVIHGSDYAVRSSPRSKYCNAPTLMRAVMNSGGYLCMVILQSSSENGRLQGDHNMCIMQLWTSAFTKKAQAGINISSLLMRRGFEEQKPQRTCNHIEHIVFCL